MPPLNLVTVVAESAVAGDPVAAVEGPQPGVSGEWFSRRFGAEPLRVEVDLDPGTDIVVYHHDQTTGAFEAALGRAGWLARRPHTDEPWVPGRPIRHR